MLSIAEQIFRHSQEDASKPALIDGKNIISYGELWANIVSVSKILREKYKLTQGDKIILAADKQKEFVYIYFAAHISGVTVIPIAPDTNLKRYELIKSKTAPGVVIGFGDSAGIDINEINEFADNTGSADENFAFPDLDSQADIIFTTGTTGEPKGVILSHRNISAAAENINSFIKNSGDDTEMLALPVSHSFGLGRMRCALSNGQTLILLGSFANVKRFFRFMGEYKANGFGMVPAVWSMLKKLSGSELGKYKSQIHYIEIGSAPMDINEKKFLSDLLPETRICMHYGLTEASRSAFMEFHRDSQHLNTIGRESPNMHISIRDENGLELADNSEGEICVKGDAVTSGYLDLPGNNYFWGDYFRTGDWGSRDSEGYITLKSRKKELINVGGKKVSPVEVEDVLKSFDFVKDCACIAIPDPEGILGEVVKAFIVTGQPEKINYEYLDELIGSRLEGFKHPAEYEIIDAIPKTSSGKIQRLALIK